MKEKVFTGCFPPPILPGEEWGSGFNLSIQEKVLSTFSAV
jgi:hypothetical protein